jgi:hypothetical protein
VADRPTLPEVLRTWLEAQQAEIHTALPGKVKSYDPDTQTADIVPVIKQATPRKDGSVDETALSVIPNVRVLWPRAGGAYLHLPMAAGDYVLLVFNEAAIGHWRDTGQVPSPPGDLSRHSLSYPYAIPGGWPDAGAFELPDGYGQKAVFQVPDVLCVGTGAGVPQLVAGGEKVNDELTTLKTNLATLVTALQTWFGLLNGDAATFTTVAPTAGPGVAALNTALGAFQSAHGSWPSATVEIETLEAE